jgi:hypothetical protein
MKSTATFLATLTAVGVSLGAAFAQDKPTAAGVQTAPVVEAKTPDAAGKKIAVKQPVIQLAILLDTSNSMDGLIDQAKSQLWKIVNQVLPLTDDLDKVSQQLFALKTNGGEEYCGAVIKSAIDQLDWSKDSADLKVIYIAGNEPFSQGPINR